MRAAPAAVSRLLALAFVALLATATFTYGAEQTRSTGAKKPTGKTQRTLVVPDVRGKPYVFAEGMLEEKGFAWRVTGRVPGFAANTVVSQSPAPWTRVVDTGAPTITLELQANPKYAQVGVPQNAAPFRGTPIRLPAAVPAKPATNASTGQQAGAIAATAARPPAFVVQGAPSEPLSQPPLPQLARKLGVWLDKHPSPTAENRAHFSYQNWLVVSGAKFGWWRGAEALQLLIKVDKRAERKWGIGPKARNTAQKALLEVQARAR